jgi:nucleoside-diphosphate-sugar epimerase
VVHLAALVQEWGPWEPFRRINVEGTRSLAAAAVESGVRRFLFMSSLAVHGRGDYEEGNEDAPRDHTGNPYARSKVECEDLLNDLHAAGTLETVIIRPGLVPYGEGDVRGFLALQRALSTGPMPVSGSPDRLTCTVYAGNLARGVALATESPAAAGRTYVIVDDNRVSWRDYFKAITRNSGTRLRFLRLPSGPVILAARLCEWVWGLAQAARLAGPGARPPVTEYLARLMTRDTRFVSDRATAELGYVPTVAFGEAMARTCRWAEERSG